LVNDQTIRGVDVLIQMKNKPKKKKERKKERKEGRKEGRKRRENEVKKPKRDQSEENETERWFPIDLAPNRKDKLHL